jgi:hypothetical protein
MSKKLIFFGVLLLSIVLVLAACGSPAPTATQAPAQPTQAPAKPTEPPQPTEVPKPTEAPLVIPNLDSFKASGHADVTAMAFNDWNEANPPEVPTACARCHTSAGFQEFVATGHVAKGIPAPAGTLECETCHNASASTLVSVTFPSGKVVYPSDPEEGEALCMTCHQGRESKVSVDKQIATFNVTDDVDKVISEPVVTNGVTSTFGFRNIHYFAAGATLHGSEAQGGYEYDGKAYDPKFRHVEGLDTCTGCHDQHATQVKVELCGECHQGVKTVDDLKNNREPSSLVDYNGNGDVREGIYYEISGLQDILYNSIQAYANEVVKAPIVYDPEAYPYWFKAGPDGKPLKDDKGNAVNYNANWTARLLKAAYNYQLSVKDPGAFAHNAKYVIELLHDSIEDLNGKISQPVDMTKLGRDDAGHFAGNTEPFRHWDADGTGVVPAGCAKCHSATGLPTFLANNGTQIVTPSGIQYTGIVAQPISNGFECATCHDVNNFPNRRAVVNVPFPNGKSLTFSTEKDDKGNLKPVDANLCLECHQGRESTVTVNNAIAAAKPKSDDEVVLKADGKTPALSFRNVHYFAAGATLFGDVAQGAYQYEGQKYNGQNMHAAPTGAMNQCTDCHDVHALTVQVEKCAGCHTTVKTLADLENIRMSPVDYNGNGDMKEGIYQEIDTFRTALFAAIQKYAADQAGKPIVYDPVAYPYFFVADQDGNQAVDDKGAAIGYNAWTPRLLRAAYNYQYSVKDPGAFAHNPQYVMQFLYDSTRDLGGDVKGLTRPEVTAPPAQ